MLFLNVVAESISKSFKVVASNAVHVNQSIMNISSVWLANKPADEALAAHVLRDGVLFTAELRERVDDDTKHHVQSCEYKKFTNNTGIRALSWPMTIQKEITKITRTPTSVKLATTGLVALFSGKTLSPRLLMSPE